MSLYYTKYIFKPKDWTHFQKFDNIVVIAHVERSVNREKEI